MFLRDQYRAGARPPSRFRFRRRSKSRSYAARDATAVVAFDTFYKVTRFAVLSCLIGAETVLPHQIRGTRRRRGRLRHPRDARFHADPDDVVWIGIGRLEELARRASITLAGMVLISTLMVLFQWSSDAFTVAYVIVYGAGSLLYAECLSSLVRRCGAARRVRSPGKMLKSEQSRPEKDDCGDQCAKCEPQGCCKIASSQSSFRSRHGAMIGDV